VSTLATRAFAARSFGLAHNLGPAKAVADGRAGGPGVRVRMLTFRPHDELEGYRPLEGGRGLFVTSSAKNNVVVGEVTLVASRESRPEH
jgi:hypothetical protein